MDILVIFSFCIFCLKLVDVDGNFSNWWYIECLVVLEWQLLKCQICNVSQKCQNNSTKNFIKKWQIYTCHHISTRKTGPEVLYTYTTYYRHLQKPSPGYENANELWSELNLRHFSTTKDFFYHSHSKFMLAKVSLKFELRDKIELSSFESKGSSKNYTLLEY